MAGQRGALALGMGRARARCSFGGKERRILVGPITGEVSRARVTPAYGAGVRRFLTRFEGAGLEVTLSVVRAPAIGAKRREPIARSIRSAHLQGRQRPARVPRSWETAEEGPCGQVAGGCGRGPRAGVARYVGPSNAPLSRKARPILTKARLAGLRLPGFQATARVAAGASVIGSHRTRSVGNALAKLCAAGAMARPSWTANAISNGVVASSRVVAAGAPRMSSKNQFENQPPELAG
jgi:hypothetical protein